MPIAVVEVHEMYFLSIEERRVLLRKLLPEARAVGVVEELRGWNWDRPPLSPIYEGKLSVYEVASQTCRSGQDLYSRRVLGLRSGPGGSQATHADALRAVARDVIVQAKRLILEYGPNCLSALVGLGEGSYKEIGWNVTKRDGDRLDMTVPDKAILLNMAGNLAVPVHHEANGLMPKAGTNNDDVVSSLEKEIGVNIETHGQMKSLGLVSPPRWGVKAGADRSGAAVQLVRQHTARRIVSVVEEVLTRYPKLGRDALLCAALPVMVEYRLDGSLLGLAKRLTVDILSVGERIPTVVKFGPKKESHRLAVTGYAMVIESLWECPINIGCVASVSLAKGRVIVERDLYVIGDELRQQFIESRDERARLVEEEIDPGLCMECQSGCRFCG
jgi:CRISPR-associated protein Cas4/Csa1 subtype I-A